MQLVQRAEELDVLGTVTVVASAEGIVAVLLGRTERAERYLARIGGAEVIGDSPRIRDAFRQLGEYAAGERERFRLPLAPQGTPFQREVWAAVEAIPYGETRTYSEIAAVVGRPRAVRAVGAANGANPICVVVPCHRVIGSSGSLTGYAYGLERKQALLLLEARADSRLTVV